MFRPGECAPEGEREIRCLYLVSRAVGRSKIHSNDKIDDHEDHGNNHCHENEVALYKAAKTLFVFASVSFHKCFEGLLDTEHPNTHCGNEKCRYDKYVSVDYIPMACIF